MDKDYENFVARMGSFEDTFDLGNPELKHYGILGMKWGKRKASNDDSSGPTKGNPDKEFSPRRMSNKELNARLKRLRLEEEYARMLNSRQQNTLTQVDGVAKHLKSAATLTGDALKIYNNINTMVTIGTKVADMVNKTLK